MYLVTGGGGFIGSNIVAQLADSGSEVAVCDWLTSDERWRNLAKHEVAAIISPDRLGAWMDRWDDRIAAVVHMGAISDTTESNVDRLVDKNIRATLDLLDWCTERQRPLIYASSAATYGDGQAGFEDELTPRALQKLRPLNAYGWSKHVVDKRIARLMEQGARMPPQCVGLKFFNVFGPNEYHKGRMRSIIASGLDKLLTGESLRLFRSYNPDFSDGGQLRDFIYVKDCVDVVVWLLSNPSISGLFNVGTGRARSWLDLGSAMFAALNRTPSIEFIDMPLELRGKYQYFTEAKVHRLRAAGYERPFTELEVAVRDYVGGYLTREDPYR